MVVWRQMKHHGVARAIAAFVSDTAGCAATLESSAFAHFVPDLVVDGDPGIAGLVEIKTTAKVLDSVAPGLRRDAILKYSRNGVDAARLHVLVFDVRGDCDGPTQRYLRKLTRARAQRGTWDGREAPGVRALIGRALAAAAVASRAEYRQRLAFRGRQPAPGQSSLLPFLAEPLGPLGAR